MTRSSLIHPGQNITLTLVDNGGGAKVFSAVVAGVDDSGIYVHGETSDDGVMYPWWNVIRIEY